MTNIEKTIRKENPFKPKEDRSEQWAIKNKKVIWVQLVTTHEAMKQDNILVNYKVLMDTKWIL